MRGEGFVVLRPGFGLSGFVLRFDLANANLRVG